MALGPLSVEQIDKRSSNIKHYKNLDGAFSAVISNGPIHYKATQGGPWLNKRQQFAAGPGTNEWISNQSDVTMRTYQLGAGGNRTWWIQFTETMSGQGVEFQVLGQPSTTEGSNTLSFQDGASRTWTYTHTRSGGKMWGPPMDSTEPATTYTFNYRLLGGAPALSVTPEGDLVCGSIFRMPRSYMRGADGFNYPASAWQIGSGTVSFTMDHVAAGLPLQAYPFRLDPSTTFNVAASANDSYAYSLDGASFPPGGINTYVDTHTSLYGAKEISSGFYGIYVMLLKWNTAFIDDTATVTGATLQLTNTDEAGAFVNTNSKTMSGGWYTGAFSAAGYTATAETDAFSGFNFMANTTSGATVSIPLSNAVTSVNKSANTALRLHLSDGGTPTGRNVCGYASYDHATLNEPRLVVDYNAVGTTLSIPALSANDAYTYYLGATWPGSAGTAIVPDGATVAVGKNLVTTSYFEYIGQLRFNTSSIDDNAAVIGASLLIYPTAFSAANGVLSVVGNWASLSLTTADWQRNIGTSAFNALAFDSFALNSYNSITLNNAASNINKTGNTDIKLGSTNLASDAAPTGSNQFSFASAEAVGNTPPILSVTVRLPNLEIETFLIHATGTAATSAEGSERYDSTRDILQYHDGVREKTINEMGFMPYAYPIGGSSTLTTTTNLSLSSAQAVAMPVVLEGHMLLDGVSFWDVATGTARGPLEFGIYEERLNNSNTLDLVTGAVGTVAAYTPTVASLRTMAVTSPPVYLPPGCYWLVIKNNHASNGSQIAGALPGTMASNVAQTKVFTTAALGSTLDFVAATWTKIGNVPGVRLNGRVLGQATAF